jgi:hypothetical protein
MSRDKEMGERRGDSLRFFKGLNTQQLLVINIERYIDIKEEDTFFSSHHNI